MGCVVETVGALEFLGEGITLGRIKVLFVVEGVWWTNI
jgi:hypothetical protein